MRYNLNDCVFVLAYFFFALSLRARNCSVLHTKWQQQLTYDSVNAPLYSVSSRSSWTDAYSSAVIYWLDVLRIHYNWFLLFSFFVFVFLVWINYRALIWLSHWFFVLLEWLCVCSICLLFSFWNEFAMYKRCHLIF